MITRTRQTLLNDGSLTTDWNETGIDVSSCVKVAVIISYSGTSTEVTAQPFNFLVGLLNDSEICRTYGGVFSLNDDFSDIIHLDTVGFETMNITIKHASEVAVSGITVAIEKVIA